MEPTIADAKRVADALKVVIEKIDRREPAALAVDAAPVGRRQLERSFKALGTSPYKEVMRLRLRLAAAELTDTRARHRHLAGIAMGLGYGDERRLREATRAAYGLSPSELRHGAEINRKLSAEEAARQGRRATPYSARGWNSAYRRRRDRKKLQRLLARATRDGQKVLLGKFEPIGVPAAKRDAHGLATTRTLELFEAARPALRQVA
jgi:AraC-like DNA-binding protein